MTSSPAWRAVLLVHLLAAFALPSAAHAAIASSDGSTIRVTSGPEALSVGIGESSNPGALYITQLTDVGIEPGAGCVAVRAGVECAYAGTPTVIVDLGEGDDTALVTPEAPMEIHVSGGPGDDRLDTRNRLSDLPTVAWAVLDGGPGDDRFDVSGGVADTIVGGEGVDEVSYWRGKGATTITLNGFADDGFAGERDNVGADVEELEGSLSASNRIVGDDAPQKLAGHGQADVLDGGGGDDFITGESGNDVLMGGAGDDSVLGGDGDDRVDGGPGADELYGYAGNDTLVARDGGSDKSVACDAGVDSAIVDLLRDDLAVQDCERVDRAWIAAPALTTGTFRLHARRGRLRWPLTCRAAAGARCVGRVAIETAGACGRASAAGRWSSGARASTCAPTRRGASPCACRGRPAGCCTGAASSSAWLARRSPVPRSRRQESSCARGSEAAPVRAGAGRGASPCAARSSSARRRRAAA